MKKVTLTSIFVCLMISLFVPGLVFGSTFENQAEIGSTLNFGISLYETIKNLLLLLLKKTLFRSNPVILQEYQDVITLLISVTAAWIIISVIHLGKKLIGWILVFGWGLLGLSLAIRIFG